MISKIVGISTPPFIKLVHVVLLSHLLLSLSGMGLLRQLLPYKFSKNIFNSGFRRRDGMLLCSPKPISQQPQVGHAWSTPFCFWLLKRNIRLSRITVPGKLYLPYLFLVYDFFLTPVASYCCFSHLSPPVKLEWNGSRPLILFAVFGATIATVMGG
jgi:hypothetical protein